MMTLPARISWAIFMALFRKTVASLDARGVGQRKRRVAACAKPRILA
jgi:hypothetical protein